jgi:hypothetical protein
MKEMRIVSAITTKVWQIRSIFFGYFMQFSKNYEIPSDSTGSAFTCF